MNISKIGRILSTYSTKARIVWFGLSLLAGFYLVLIAAFPVPEFIENIRNPFLVALTAAILYGVVIFGLTVFLVTLQLPYRPHPGWRHRRFAWLRFALPMLFVWGLYWLAFFPAVMSPDSVVQWSQVQTGQYNNAHPVFHTLILWLLTRVWETPAIVVFVQILAAGFLTGWGLGALTRKGLPEWWAWVVAILFAISPVNGMMTITVWKDIPYSISILGLTLVILMLSLEPARWFHQKGLWILFGVLAIFISQVRHNGLIVAPVVLGALALVYRRRWWIFARALILCLTVWLLVQGPIFSLLKVKTESPFMASIALHHIGAHLNAKTPLAPEDKELIEQLMPMEKWDYRCDVVNSIVWNKSINSQSVMANTSRLNRLAIKLFLQDPQVNLKHLSCSGSLVYRITQYTNSYLYTFEPMHLEGGVMYINTSPGAWGLNQQSVLPELLSPFINFGHKTAVGWLAWLYWRPAAYLYLLIFTGYILALRARSWRASLFILPGLVQSLALFFVNIAQDFRYQYPVYLVGLFSLALLLLPACIEDRSE